MNYRGFCILILCLLNLVVLGQGGDSGGVGAGVGDDNGSGGTGTCCQASQLNSATLMLGDGNYTAMVEPDDITIINNSAHDSTVVLIGENDETGSQVSGSELIPAGRAVTVNRGQFGDATIVYLAGIQRFTISLGHQKNRSEKSGRAGVNPPREHLSTIRVVNPNETIVTVGVDAEFRVHYPVHGQIVGRYDVESKAVILNNGVMLDTTR